MKHTFTNNRFSYAFLCLSLSILCSCSSKKNIVVTDSPSTIISGNNHTQSWSNNRYNPITVAEAFNEWTDFSVNGKIHLTSSSTMSSSMLLKMVRGKSISISLRPMLGIEVGKLYIDNENVTIIDKVHNIYVQESIEKYFEKGTALITLQNLLLSRPFDAIDGYFTIDNALSFEATAPDNNDSWMMSPANNNLVFKSEFEMIANNVKRLIITTIGGSKYFVDFNLFKNVSGSVLATNIESKFNIGANNISIKLEYTKSFRWNNYISDELKIPNDAKRYSLDQISKSITGK